MYNLKSLIKQKYYKNENVLSLVKFSVLGLVILHFENH